MADRQRLVESTRLAEAAPSATSGEGRVQLITPGWGSSGYYGKDVLAEAATRQVFPAGTHMYLDHPTVTEGVERPERSVRDWAAVLTEDATVDAGGGLSAPFRVFSPFRTALAEMKDVIGVSIRASGLVEPGEAEGRHGPIVTSLDEGMSVDFVTAAGRGGRVLELVESRRAPLREAHGMTANDLRDALDTAIRDAYGGEDTWIWLRDYADTWAVFSVETPGSAALWQQDYAVADRTVALTGDRVEVTARTTYIPVGSPPPVTEARPGGQPPTATSRREPRMSGTNTGKPPAEGEPTGTPPPAEVTEAATRVQQLEKDLAEARAQLETRSNFQVRLAEAERKLTERDLEVARLRAAETARTQTAAKLAESGLPEPAHARVVAAVIGHEGQGVPLTEAGAIDADKLQARIDAAIKAEGTYVASIAEASGVGLPRNLGGDGQKAPDLAELDKQLNGEFQRLGLTESGARLATSGRG